MSIRIALGHFNAWSVFEKTRWCLRIGSRVLWMKWSATWPLSATWPATYVISASIYLQHDYNEDNSRCWYIWYHASISQLGIATWETILKLSGSSSKQERKLSHITSRFEFYILQLGIFRMLSRYNLIKPANEQDNISDSGNGVFPKNGGKKNTKMDGLFHEKPY